MTTLDHIFSDIAKTHLNIPTLKLRMSDAFDFHEVAIWNLRTALAAAFNAGVASQAPSTAKSADAIQRYDAYEIQPCRKYANADDPTRTCVEPCEISEAEFWTLYGHIPGKGFEAIGDFDTREYAEEVFAKITGRAYHHWHPSPR